VENSAEYYAQGETYVEAFDGSISGADAISFQVIKRALRIHSDEAMDLQTDIGSGLRAEGSRTSEQFCEKPRLFISYKKCTVLGYMFADDET
jgi:hypothetical protein